jgi:phosphatidylglycerophosphatase C
MSPSGDVKVLALFDFDETLTMRDTLPAFLAFLQPAPGFYFKAIQALPAILMWKLGFSTNQKAKEALMRAFMEGKTLVELEEKGRQFAKEVMPRFWREEAVEKLKWHLAAGHEVWVVSASCETWVVPAMSIFPEVRVIGSQLSVCQGLVSGQLEGKNCHGPEKATRIHEAIAVSSYTTIYAYGDSQGDHEMLALADQAFYRRF